MNYARMAEAIKRELDTELGFTFSVGLAPSKVVAKIASKWQKPSGLTIIKGRDMHTYLAHQQKQHEGERGDAPERTRQLLKGETKRKRLGIPMFLGKMT